jgi:MarR-like DNA-binding transcriptional regulator SgrR of sgrS sRNA
LAIRRSLTLAVPLAVFPKFLAMPVASIVPADPAPDLGARPVGTGPWRFAAWAHDDALRFARNPDYWGGAPQAESLVVRIIPDQLVRAAELESGRLDVVEVPFGETARWRERHPAWLQEKPALRVTYIALNNRRGALRTCACDRRSTTRSTSRRFSPPWERPRHPASARSCPARVGTRPDRVRLRPERASSCSPRPARRTARRRSSGAPPTM